MEHPGDFWDFIYVMAMIAVLVICYQLADTTGSPLIVICSLVGGLYIDWQIFKYGASKGRFKEGDLLRKLTKQQKAEDKVQENQKRQDDWQEKANKSKPDNDDK